MSVLPKAPCVTGAEHIPSEGSFKLVSNHYQRLDLWIGWSGALLINAIAQQRDVSIHYVTTDRARIGRFTVPGTRWLIERVAAVWGLVLVTPPIIGSGHMEDQRYALLRMLRLLKQNDGRSICLGIMPEGDEGITSGLIDALPGSGRALYALSTKGLPLLPAAVWEEDCRLHAHFGAPFHLTEAKQPTEQFAEQPAKNIDNWARETVMQCLALLLPESLRGNYGRMSDGTLE